MTKIRGMRNRENDGSRTATQAPFPGIVVHHPGPSPISGHGEEFQIATVHNDEDASSYFEKSGIVALADGNGGLCTFWLGEELAFYQSTNVPLTNDENLEPSINANADLFGSFLGALRSDNVECMAKHAVIERVLGSAKFINRFDAHVQHSALDYMATVEDRTMQLVAHINSNLPGILDFKDRPLTYYLTIEIPANTMLWLDRRHTNRDSGIFPYPNRFDTRNIEYIMKTNNGQPFSVLARNRFEINSFSMVNTNRSPRKYPGRLFSVKEQALVLVELYRAYKVMVSGTDMSLALHRSMLRPRHPGNISLKRRFAR